MAAISGAIFIGHGDKFWLKLKSIWNWFFDYDSVFGEYDRNGFRLKKSACQPHLHQYEFYESLKHKWYLVDGKPAGTRNNLVDVIRTTKLTPGHTETKIEDLLEWQRRGYDIVFTSWNRWKCKVCGNMKNTEFYTMPSKSNELSSYVYDLNKNKQTQAISTFGRKEIPVEPMKIFK